MGSVMSRRLGIYKKTQPLCPALSQDTKGLSFQLRNYENNKQAHALRGRQGDTDQRLFK